MIKHKKPELLAPAGDLDKLEIAINYGADAVYLGGQNYGLRAKSKNFDITQMKKGIDFAHSKGVKVYVTANIFAHNEDLFEIGDYFKELEKIGADALIISDPGIFSIAREVVKNMDIHISTQANNTNYKSVEFWKNLGAKRVVLARELSFNEIKYISDYMGNNFELEAFVHGAMCISYSGRCLLSNYMSNRDSNKGACSHPCRFEYHLVEKTRPNENMFIEEDARGSYIFNSKDLCMLSHIPELINSGVNSFKIEGRMKTPYYVATTVKAYRDAIDDYFENVEKYELKKHSYIDEVEKSSHREFTTGFYFSKPTANEQIYTTSSYIRTFDFIGIVLDYNAQTQFATIEQRNKFVLGDEVEFLMPKGEGFTQIIRQMYDGENNPIEDAPHPQQIIRLKTDKPVKNMIS